MTERSDPPSQQRRRWPLFLLMILAAVSLLLQAAKFGRGREISRLGRQYADLLRTRPVAATKARRARYYESRFYLGYPAAASFAAAGLVRRLGKVFGPQRLLVVRIDPGLHDLGFQLTAGIGGKDAGQALWTFARLCEELRMFPDVSDLSWVEKGSTGHGGLRLFVASGRAELP
jgi:hypothetical protein